MNRFKCDNCGNLAALTEEELAQMPFPVSEWICNQCHEGHMRVTGIEED